MGMRKILTDQDPALHKVCKPVVFFDRKLHKLLDDMKETLADANGVGLAAPQMVYIMNELKESGLRVRTDVATIEEARDAILDLLKKKEAPAPCREEEGEKR